ncbi:hypothetical protein MKX03_018044, partial [Papaver bracteatum]
MDNQWVTRVINIRDSFEKSKTIAVHAYSQSLVTRKLEYIVSHTTLQLISVELTSMGKSLFRGRCLCIIRKTHGLPCAYEILKNHKNGNKIPLDSIHEHWKQLSMIPAHEKVASVFDLEDLFEKKRIKYETCTELQKHFMLGMLIEIADPSKTNMQEPRGKFATKGRPTIAQTEAQKKKYNSTHMDLSWWERPSAKTTSTAASKKVPVKPKKVSVKPKKVLVNPRKKAGEYNVVDEAESIKLFDLNELPDLNEVEEHDIFPSKLMLKRKKVQCTKESVQRRKYTKNIKTNNPDVSYDEEYLKLLIKYFDNPKILTDVVDKLEN